VRGLRIKKTWKKRVEKNRGKFGRLGFGKPRGKKIMSEQYEKLRGGKSKILPKRNYKKKAHSEGQKPANSLKVIDKDDE